MSVQITDSKHVCLFCSTTDEAFGPIFDSEGEAHDFLDWIAETTGDSDVRRFTSAALTNLQLQWERDRDPDQGDVAIYGAGAKTNPGEAR